MSRLENTPKKPYFTVPEDYFEHLPTRIQNRISTSSTRPSFSPLKFAVRYALPVLLLIAAYLHYSPIDNKPEDILASVETEDLMIYLQDTGMSTEEMIETLELTPAEIEALESEIYGLTLQDLEGFDVN